MNESTWLKNLKVGDEVAVPQRFSQGYNIKKVVRVTPTQIVVGQYGERYRRANGHSIGTTTWNTGYLREPTPDIRELAEVATLRQKALTLREHLRIPQTKDDLVAFIEALTPLVKESK